MHDNFDQLQEIRTLWPSALQVTTAQVVPTTPPPQTEPPATSAHQDDIVKWAASLEWAAQWAPSVTRQGWRAALSVQTVQEGTTVEVQDSL